MMESQTSVAFTSDNPSKYESMELKSAAQTEFPNEYADADERGEESQMRLGMDEEIAQHADPITPAVSALGPMMDQATAYVQSNDFYELIGCLVFHIVATSYTKLPVSVRERPMPVQVLESSGEYLRNPMFDEEYGGDTVPGGLLKLLSIVLPGILQFLLILLTVRVPPGHRTSDPEDCALLHAWKKRFLYFHRTACVYLVSLGIMYFVTEFVKLYVGYLRPIFFALCDPDDNYENCTGDDTGLNRSFPSAHSGTAFCGLTVFSLFIHNQYGVPSVMRQHRQRQRLQYHQLRNGFNDVAPRYDGMFGDDDMVNIGGVRLGRLISMLSLLPLMLAVFIAASRIADNRHFPADVIAGSVLGSSCAVFVTNLWWL